MGIKVNSSTGVITTDQNGFVQEIGKVIKNQGVVTEIKLNHSAWIPVLASELQNSITKSQFPGLNQSGNAAFISGPAGFKYDLSGTQFKVETDASGNEVRVPVSPASTAAASEAARLEFNQAAEQRRQTVTGGFDQLLGRSQQALAGVGNQARLDINQASAAEQSQVLQDTTSRGLTGTTILPTLKSGVRRRNTEALNRLGSNLAQQRVGVDVDITGKKLDFIGRQRDLPPDSGQLLNLFLASGGTF